MKHAPFFAELMRDNLPARNLVDSNFVMVNARLAALYGLPDVQGSRIRRVALPKDSARGGLLTQASVLESHGERHDDFARPAGSLDHGADYGAARSAPAARRPRCGTRHTRRDHHPRTTGETPHPGRPASACHARIDPPGFALESPSTSFGGWRDHYRALGDGQKDDAQKVPGYRQERPALSCFTPPSRWIASGVPGRWAALSMMYET